jgi:hypothetical protein
MVLEFLPHAVRKSVCNFTAYTAQNHTSLEAIIAAHRVAREAAQEAKSRKTRQVLTVSESDPCLMFDTYTTTTGPIGTLAEPTDPEVRGGEGSRGGALSHMCDQVDYGRPALGWRMC